MSLAGWRVTGEVPDVPKYVVIAAPHTSYWDFVHMMAFGFATSQYISYMMKNTMFWWPLKYLLEGMGGIPVDRSRSNKLVQQLVDEFAARDELVVVVPPEGKRARREYWKSGFYHVAHGAGVPIALGFLDYGRREVGYGGLLWPSGDIENDMVVIREFYRDKRGKHPEMETPARLPEKPS